MFWSWIQSCLGVMIGEFDIGGTNASVKSYQLVKVVSGGRAPGKSSSLASPQLLVMNNFIVLGPCAWKKFIFLLR